MHLSKNLYFIASLVFKLGCAPIKVFLTYCKFIKRFSSVGFDDIKFSNYSVKKPGYSKEISILIIFIILNKKKFLIYFRN